MRTIEEVREEILGAFQTSVQCPQMYAVCDRDTEGVIADYLRWVSFIDQRIHPFNRLLYRRLDCREMRHCHGIRGEFAKYFPAANCFMGEVASIYAEFGFAMGYLDVKRTLSAVEFTELRRTSWRTCRERDWTLDEIKARHGEPSWEVRNVLCYASTDLDQGWVYFDFGTHGNDHLLRNVRLPTDQFVRGLIVSPAAFHNQNG